MVLARNQSLHKCSLLKNQNQKRDPIGKNFMKKNTMKVQENNSKNNYYKSDDRNDGFFQHIKKNEETLLDLIDRS